MKPRSYSPYFLDMIHRWYLISRTLEESHISAMLIIKLTFLHFEWWKEVDGALHIFAKKRQKKKRSFFSYPKKRNKSFTIRLLALKGLFDAVHSISRRGTKKLRRISVFKHRSEIGLCCVMLLGKQHRNNRQGYKNSR